MFTIEIYNPLFFFVGTVLCDLYTTERINSITFFFFFLFYYVGNVSKESQSAVSSGCSAGCFIHLSLRQTCTFSTVCGVGSYGRAAVAHTEKKLLFAMNISFQLDPREMYLVMFLNMWNYLLWIVCWISWMFPVKRVTCVSQFDVHLNALFLFKKRNSKDVLLWWDETEFVFYLIRNKYNVLRLYWQTCRHIQFILIGFLSFTKKINTILIKKCCCY